MKRGILFLVVLIFSLSLVGDSYFDSLYTIPAKRYSVFINQNVTPLYAKNKRQREELVERYKVAIRQPRNPGDAYFLYRSLADFVTGRLAPAELLTNEDYRDDIAKVQEEVLDYLIESAENQELSDSEREFVVFDLATIAAAESLSDFDWNEDAVKALGEVADSDHLMLSHLALIGLKPIVLKTDKKWMDVVEDAADFLVEGLDSDRKELQRIAFRECLDVLQRAQVATVGVNRVWEKVIATTPEISSHQLWQDVNDNARQMATRKLTGPFSAQAKALLKMLETVKRTPPAPQTKSRSEMIALVREETDIQEVEWALNALETESKSGQSAFYDVYTGLSRLVLEEQPSEYKLRLINQTLINMTHSIKRPLFFHETAMLFIREVYVLRDSHQATIPLAMLGNLLASTDYEGLNVPVIHEIADSITSDLPIWIRRRLIGLLFIQAGDSPTEQIGLVAANHLIELANFSKNSMLRWEAVGRLRYLAEFAAEDTVRTHTANWK